MKKLIHHIGQLVMLTALSVCSMTISTTTIYASEKSVRVQGNLYEYTDNKDFNLTKDDESSKTSPQNTIGSLELNGTYYQDPSHDVGFISETDDVTVSYIINDDKLKKKDGSWNIVDTKTKKLISQDLGKQIKSGAILIQTSTDGIKWVTDTVLTDVFKDQKSIPENIYSLKDIQLENGCFMKVTVAYTLEKITGTKKFLFFTFDEKETKQVIEEYEFFLSGSKASNVTIDTLPRKEFSSIINTGKDNGYSSNVAIEKNDPHFGWDIGYFTINGYTRETEYDGTPIYLKNHGDKVTLWFTLKQDINCINGNNNLRVANDTDGYDKYFKVDNINFKHGTLLIRYTDENGNAKEPVIYTDFLAANATTTANTKVQLFEEGDYEVCLDYELEEKTGIGSLIKTYNDYKLSFSFKIRNGNNMVFPFDLESGNELSNGSITENGFRLDLAQSKYLTIDVTKSVIKQGSNKLLTNDIRFNRPAKDGEEYTEEGIYTVTVKNLYTDSEPTVKTIYVGTNKYMKALAKYNLTLEELNNQIRDGAKVNNDGSLSNSSLKSVN